MKKILIVASVFLSMNSIAQEKIETTPAKTTQVETSNSKVGLEKTTVERAKMDVKTLNSRLKVAEMEQEKNGVATQSTQPSPAKKD